MLPLQLYQHDKCKLTVIVGGFCRREQQRHHPLPSEIACIIVQYIHHKRGKQICAVYNIATPKRFSKRIYDEWQSLQNPPRGCIIKINPSNHRHWKFMVRGPADTPFEGGYFLFEVFLWPQYPLRAPKIRCLTKIYHPQFDAIGRMYFGDLVRYWSAQMNMHHIIELTQRKLAKPNCQDEILDNRIAEKYRYNPVEAHRIAHEWTLRYASSATLCFDDCS